MEEIVTKLGQIRQGMGQGLSHLEAVRQIGIFELTHFRWRRQYGGMGVAQLKEL